MLRWYKTPTKCGGLWCLNNSLLEEENYIAMISDCIGRAKEQQLKIKCKEFTIKYAVKMNCFLKRAERDLRQKVQYEPEWIGNDEDHGVEDYLLAKDALVEYEKNKCYAAIVRSRVQYAIEGERCTSFFLNLEKRTQEKTYITELINDKGDKVNDLVGILDTVEIL